MVPSEDESQSGSVYGSILPGLRDPFEIKPKHVKKKCDSNFGHGSTQA